MAVQKSKKSRSKRNHRISSKNSKLKLPILFFNKINKEYNLYHHVDKNYLKNFKIKRK